MTAITKATIDALNLIRSGRVSLVYRMEPGVRRLSSTQPVLSCRIGDSISAATFRDLVERGWVEWPDATILAAQGLTVVGGGAVPVGADGTVSTPVRLTLQGQLDAPRS
jgi:hypothetical protein